MCIIVLGVEYCFDVGVVGWWGQFFLLLVLVDSARDHQQGAGSPWITRLSRFHGERFLSTDLFMAHLSVLLFYVGNGSPATRETRDARSTSKLNSPTNLFSCIYY